MPVRRHDLVGVVEPVGRVHGVDGGAPRREARVDQDQGPTLAVVHGDELGGPIEDRFDVGVVGPQVRDRLLASHQLLDLVMRDVCRSRPEREHVAGVKVVVQRLQGRVAVAAVVADGGNGAHRLLLD